MVGIRSISNARRLLAAAVCLCMALPLGACGSRSDPAPTNTITVAGETRFTGSVAMFLPNDVFTVSQDVPLNSWHDFADATTDSLEDRGFEADHVRTYADADLERQSHRVQDYVVDALDGSTDSAGADPDAQSMTLVVAPAAPMTDTVKRYGDYATQSLAQGADAEKNATDAPLDESLSRMSRALGLAKKAGMHVVVLATPLPGFTPDAFVSLCSAREIGRLQARQLVSKLQLDSVSRYNPKYIEILLPYTEDSDHLELDAAFAREWVRQRHARRGKSAWVLDRELQRKGVAQVDRAEALEQVTQESEQSIMEDLAAKKARSVKTIPEDRAERDKVLRRIVGVLARRGFNEGASLRVAKAALEARCAELENE